MEAFLRKRKMYIFLFILLLKEKIVGVAILANISYVFSSKRFIPVKLIPCSTMLRDLLMSLIPLPEYETLIDRGAHAVYIVADALAVMTDPDPFVITLAEAHDDLTCVLDVFIARKNWNMVYTAGGAATILLATQDQCFRHA